ncbi:MAG: ribonuclease domain-containing protein [Betaproteobacteria bacterium]|nr:ribonuclease [Rhodocyclales bacterium]
MLRRVVALLCLGFALSAAARGNWRDDSPDSSIAEANLPAEARTTLRLIDRGGPYPHRRDGVTFKNLEQRLPLKRRGYYREYTVPTPGSTDRGARRIIAGEQPAAMFYYTEDHYRSFRKIRR